MAEYAPPVPQQPRFPQTPYGGPEGFTGGAAPPPPPAPFDPANPFANVPWESLNASQKGQADPARAREEMPQGTSHLNRGYGTGGGQYGGIPTIGGGGGGGGRGGVGGEQALLDYGYAQQAEQHLPGMIGLAGRETTAIQRGAEDIPLGPGGYALPLMEQGLRRQIEAPGMSPVEYAQAKRRITEGFGAQTGALAAGQAKGGFFSKGSVAQAGGGAPAQQLGQGLAELEAKNAEIQRRERESGVRTLASQYGTLSGQALGGRDAYLARVGQYQTPTPVQRQGIYTAKPSSTAPGTYSSY